ncbi:MAG: MBL fold metallo-hydrolase [Candidatus Bathyarchaeota archaeon]|nr:MBL fold metallo-hydrolase [Candidatus Bathyarchaeota archaeon]MDW8040854.1 MBL fold metallo-hydrolase [Nitrososphaerota archaeon]
MDALKIDEHIYMVDVKVAGARNFIASYILRGEKTIIVETGPASSVHNLLNGLEGLDVKPEEVAYVAVSHIHLDHGGGVGPLLRRFPKAKAVVHERGAPHLVNPEKLWQQAQMVLGRVAEIYGKPTPVPSERIVAAQDGMVLDAGGGVKLKVVETVGHAPHHLSYYEPLSNGIFTGDSAGIYLNEIDAIVPTTPAPFRLDMALASLEKMANLKPSTLYYTHFGKAENAVEKLQAYAKQLRLWAGIAKETLEKNESLDTMRQKIFERDEAVRKAVQHIKKHKVFSETSLAGSMLGVFEYVKNFGAIPA